jgi:tetratricopeptide (TPR) repeat protein
MRHPYFHTIIDSDFFGIWSQRLLLLVLTMHLMACQHHHPSPKILLESADATPAPQEAQEPSYKPFTTETLYSLLAAELAGGRAQYSLTLSNYAQQARVTGDSQIAERATRIAQYLGNAQLALEMSQIWLAASPKNKEALSAQSLAQLQLGKLTDAFQGLKQLLDAGDDPPFMMIARSATQTNDDERRQLLENFYGLLKHHPKNEQLILGAASLLQQQQKYSDALLLVQQAGKLNPDNVTASVSEATILHKLNRNKEALSLMSQLVEKFPSNYSLRQEYARLLIDNDLSKAQEQFSLLAEKLPNNGEVLFSLGIIAWERKDIVTAHNAFNRLIDQNLYPSSAHYYLGRIAEAEKEADEAILHYLQVKDSKDYYAATAALLKIFIERKDFQSADDHMKRAYKEQPQLRESLYELHAEILRMNNYLTRAERVLTAGIQTLGKNYRLLYARSLLNHQRKDFAAAEHDLRIILTQEPENANVLNALGYMLVDSNSRLDEAEQLIAKALKIKPEESAFLDSMGWLKYRRGQLKDFPNGEISAHLGEVLWIMGSRNEARQVWQNALEKDPKDPVLQETLKRFNIE